MIVLSEEVEDEEEEHEHTVKSKRLGYFDLHPDRRPVNRSQFVEDVKPSPQLDTPELRVQPPADAPRASYESATSVYDEPDPYEGIEPTAPLMVPSSSRTAEPRSVSPSRNIGSRVAPAPSLPRGPAAPVPPAPAPAPAPVAVAVAPVASKVVAKERTATPEAEAEFEFSNTKSLTCLLCARQFKSLDQLKRHNKESELHKVCTPTYCVSCVR